MPSVPFLFGVWLCGIAISVCMAMRKRKCDGWCVRRTREKGGLRGEYLYTYCISYQIKMYTYLDPHGVGIDFLVEFIEQSDGLNDHGIDLIG